MSMPEVAVDAGIHAASVEYRIDEGEKGEQITTWKAHVKDGRTSPLQVGECPTQGSVVVINDFGKVHVESVEDGLEIFTGDLITREKFDPRRIYETPSGNAVVFKRMDNDRVVLWSYTKNLEVAVNGGVSLDRSDRQAAKTASVKPKVTQKLVAAYIISNNPRITGDELTAALRIRFPNNEVGDRHGPHYLSLSRRGKLPEPPHDDPCSAGE